RVGHVFQPFKMRGPLCRILLLDHYSAQRRAIAEEYVQTHTHQNKQVIEEKDPAERAAHLERLKDVSNTPEALLAHVRKGAMLDAVEKSMAVMP
ncbi:MAG: hypothetical protein AAFY59_11170, partial [Pseudomonadota bacterium]